MNKKDSNRDIILYYKERNSEKEYKNFDRFRFYDIKNKRELNNEDLKDLKDIDNIWVDYSTFTNPYNDSNDANDSNDSNDNLVKWLLKRKYLVKCTIKDIGNYKDFIKSFTSDDNDSINSDWDIL